jgi:membrane associated rhomboid family serine protease
MTPAAVGLRCPEHSGKPQGVRRVTTRAAASATAGGRRPNLVTMVLIGINVAVYALELALGGTVNGQSNWIYDHGVLIKDGLYCATCSPIGVAHGEWWRLITAAFLHYGPIHLALNMFSLYFAGSILETVIGRWRFLVLYLVSGLAGSAGALFHTPNSPTAGASGAIFGVLGALLVLERRGNIATGGQVLGLIVLNLVFTFAVPGISVGGHVGGLIAGIAVMLGFTQFRRSPQLSIASAAAVALAAVLIAYGAA